MDKLGTRFSSRVTGAASALYERVSRRLVNKLILLFSSIIILAVASLTIISYQMLQRESVKNSISSTTNNLLLVNRNLEDYLGGIEQLSLPNLRYDELTSAILNEHKDYGSRMYLEDYLRTLFFSRKDMVTIFLYLVDEDKYYAVAQENFDVRVRIGEKPPIRDLPWYAEVMASPNNRAFQTFLLPGAEAGYSVPAPSEGGGYMAYHRVLRTIKNREPQAILSFYVNDSAVKDILADVPMDADQQLLFLDPAGEPFYADDLAYYEQLRDENLPDKLTNAAGGRFTWTAGGRKDLVVYDTSPGEGWKLVKLVPYGQLYEAANTNRDLSYLIGGLSLLLSIVLVSLTSNAITRPLKKLSHQMRRFSEGTFDAEAQVRGHDEIAYLSRHFNQMVRSTNDLINERYKMKLVEKNAILKALEAEINPHFLYNALQAISTKALKNDRYDIAEMVDALAMTLRYCISGKDVVFAREELKHIERYLSLQKARFGSRLQAEYDWDEGLKELELPKLSLQTLVENAIKHGLEKVASPVTITIRARAEGERAVISVHDDGPGFSPERLEQVERSFESDWEERDQENESIGLVNLNTRLKLLYGEAARLRIRSDASAGAESVAGEEDQDARKALGARTGTTMEMELPRGGRNHAERADHR